MPRPLRPLLLIACVLPVLAAAPSAAADERSTAVIQHRLAFVTSVEGTADLGQWADAGSATGLAAGDAICQSLATAAGLPDPGDFVAWLSTSTTDAYCHLHGLSGTKAANCGQASLPADAGPWVRVDGEPFAQDITRALGFAGEVLAPLAVDEQGNPVADLIFTATGSDGTYASARSTCGDWTDDSLDVVVGSSMRTSGGWSFGSFSGCFGDFRLACLQRGSGPPLPHHYHPGALAFTTSAGMDGDFGGAAAADTWCRSYATAAGLPHPSTFTAWISDSTTGVDAVDRYTHPGPWVRLDGMVVALTSAELSSGAVRVPLGVDENGQYLGNSGVWTGTLTSGLAAGDDCSGWTDAAFAGSATVGATNSADAWWTDFYTGSCDSGHRVYCLADFPAMIFVDDLESSYTDGWTSAVP